MKASSLGRYKRLFSTAVDDRMVTRIFKSAVGIDNITATQIRIPFRIGVMHDALVLFIFFLFFCHHEVTSRDKNPCEMFIVHKLDQDALLKQKC